MRLTLLSLCLLCLAGCRDEEPSAAPQEPGLGGRVKNVLTAPARWFDRDDEDGYTEETNVSGRPRRPRTEPPPSSDYERAVAYMRERKFSRALPHIESALEMAPESARVHSLRGDCLYQLLRFDEAIEAYQKARELDANYYPALRGLGFVYLNLGNQYYNEGEAQKAFDSYSQSLTLLRQAFRILPSDIRAAYGRAWAAEGLARFYYNRALYLKGRNDLQGAETQRDRSNAFCNEALKNAMVYQRSRPAEAQPRALVGRILERQAMLAYEFENPVAAAQHLKNAIAAWRSILEEVDREHQAAQEQVNRLELLLQRWQTQEAAVRDPAEAPLP